MAPKLPDHVWFVRSNGGSGSYPVRREGWLVVWKFIAGMIGWGIGAAAMVWVAMMSGPDWLAWVAPLFFAAGAALSAWYFIDTARRHTDYSITYTDHVKDKNHA